LKYAGNHSKWFRRFEKLSS